jgi:hypothetical protein
VTLLEVRRLRSPYLTDGTSLLPVAPRKAVADGSFPHVAIVIGATREKAGLSSKAALGGKKPTMPNGSTRGLGRKPTRSLRNIPGPRTRTSIRARISPERSSRIAAQVA